MAIGDKYVDFTRYLENCGKDTITLTLDEIDTIVGGVLPPWVRNPRRQPWGNTEQSFAAGWRNAGYVVTKVDKQNQIITFTKEHITNITSIDNVISKDSQISTLMSMLPPSIPIKIMLGGKTGILIDEVQYEGLLETIRILKENPMIVHSLAERENEEFIDEDEFLKYV